jgi:hypothetical protein
MHYSYSMDEIALEIEVPAKVLRRFLSEEACELERAKSFSEDEFRRICRLWNETGAAACFQEHGRLIRRDACM